MIYVAILLNASAGGGKSIACCKQYEQYLRKHKIPYEVFVNDWPLTFDKFNRIAVLGGDGTINRAVNTYHSNPLPMAIIPCGTGNDVANLFLGKLTQDEYFKISLSDNVVYVDAATCNHKWFINGVGIGFDGWVVKRLLAKKLFSGKMAYYTTVIGLLFFYREHEVHITYQTTHAEKSFSMPLFMLSAANGKTYGGGFNVAPFADYTDGLLECISINKIGLFKRFKYLPVIEYGRHLNSPLPFIQYDRITRLNVSSSNILTAHLDGEFMEDNNFEIQIYPKHFPVVIPASLQ